VIGAAPITGTRDSRDRTRKQTTSMAASHDRLKKP